LLASLLVVGCLLVVCVSAYVRLAGAGLGCADWPHCYGQIIVEGGRTHYGVVRIVHRLAATASLLLAFFALWVSLRPQPLQPAARSATLLTVLMLVLTLVGVWSADLQRVGVGLFNILGGLMLVAFSWRLWLATGPAQPATAVRGDPLLKVGLHCLTLTLLLGALIGARYAAVACETLPLCHGTAWPDTEVWEALNPFVRISGPTPPGDTGGVALHLLHRYAAVATLLLLGFGAGRQLAAATTRTAALTVLGLLFTVAGLGIISVGTSFNIVASVAHNVAAAALLAACSHLLWQTRMQAHA
jgi:heme A synthase